MRNLCNGLLALIMIIWSGALIAKENLPPQGIYLWSLGGDGIFLHAPAKGEFDKLFNSHKYGNAVYLASRFKNPFGFEIGYSWTERRAKGLRVLTGQSAFGITATATQMHNPHFRLQNTYLDFHGHLLLPYFNKIEAKFALGVGVVRDKIKFTHIPGFSDAMSIGLDKWRSVSTMTVRFGAGIQGLITDRVGARFMVNYETLSNLRFSGLPGGIANKPLNNSLSLVLGLYVTFTGHRQPYVYD